MIADFLRCALTTAAILLLSSASTAQGQAQDAATTAMARDLFHQALQASAEGRWAEAAERYRRVLELRDTPQVEFNLAQALVESGAVVEGSELLVRIGRDEDAPEAVRAAAETLLTRARAETGHMTLRVRGDAGGARVELDGRELPPAMWGVAMPVDPGSHRLGVFREDAEIMHREVDLSAGAALEVPLEVPAAPPIAAHDAASADVRPSSPPLAPATLQARPEDGPEVSHGGVLRSPWLWTALGVLVAGGVTAAIVVGRSSDAPILDGTFMPGRIEL